MNNNEFFSSFKRTTVQKRTGKDHMIITMSYPLKIRQRKTFDVRAIRDRFKVDEYKSHEENMKRYKELVRNEKTRLRAD